MCTICNKRGFKNWGALSEHLRQKCNVSRASIKGTWLHDITTEKRNEDAREKYQANNAAPTKQTVAPKKAPRARPDASGVAPAESAPPAPEESAAADQMRDQEVQTELSGAQIDALLQLAAGRATVHPAPPPAASSASAPVVGEARPAAPAAAPDVGSAVPKVLDAVKTWDPSTWVRFSNKPPVALRTFELDPRFARFMRTEEGQKTKSIAIQTRHVKRLLGSLDVGGLDYNSPDLIVAIYSSDVLSELRDLPMFDVKRTWTMKCANALKHWCSWHKSMLEASGNGAMVLEIGAVLSLSKRWAKRCQPAKKFRGRQLKREQADKIQKMANNAVLKAGARRAILDIDEMSKRHHRERQDQLPRRSPRNDSPGRAGVLSDQRWARC